MKVLTVATRGGALAIAQTRIVTGALKKIYPDLKIEIKKVTTKGDRDRRTALWNLKDSGFFTSLLEDALLAGEADFAVHSFKDLPTRQRDGLTIAAVCDRQFAEDCLIAAEPATSIGELPQAAKIGTSSLRRAAQLKHLRADLQPAPIRGNVTTRIRKLDEGRFDAIILARAGIERLGLSERISLIFDPAEFIPAPAQGALAVQTRSDDAETNKLVASVDDEKVRTITLAERQVLVTMQCGCHAPVGAFAEIVSDNIKICAFISDLEGKNFIKREISGTTANSNEVAAKLAEELLKAGGKEILSHCHSALDAESKNI
ncbi:MAG: hydroxymethylbilane synthase [Phycisphaerae bacterium]